MPTKQCYRASARARRQTADWLRADPYYLGDEAWHYGQPEKANPFMVGTEAHADWSRGWNDAAFEAAKPRVA